jgi:hypothetical protein
VLHPFLLATAAPIDGRRGWNYKYVDLNDAQLTARGDYVDWEPARLSLPQYVVIGLLVQGERIRLDDDVFRALSAEEGTETNKFAESLVKTRLVALSGNELQLTAEELKVIRTPDGELVAGDDNTGRLTRWVERHC